MDNETLIKLWHKETDPQRLQALNKLIDKSLNQIQGHGLGWIIAKEKKQAEEPTLILELKQGEVA